MADSPEPKKETVDHFAAAPKRSRGRLRRRPVARPLGSICLRAPGNRAAPAAAPDPGRCVHRVPAPQLVRDGPRPDSAGTRQACNSASSFQRANRSPLAADSHLRRRCCPERLRQTAAPPPPPPRPIVSSPGPKKKNRLGDPFTRSATQTSGSGRSRLKKTQPLSTMPEPVAPS